MVISFFRPFRMESKAVLHVARWDFVSSLMALSLSSAWQPNRMLNVIDCGHDVTFEDRPNQFVEIPDDIFAPQMIISTSDLDQMCFHYRHLRYWTIALTTKVDSRHQFRTIPLAALVISVRANSHPSFPSCLKSFSLSAPPEQAPSFLSFAPSCIYL